MMKQICNRWFPRLFLSYKSEQWVIPSHNTYGINYQAGAKVTALVVIKKQWQKTLFIYPE